MTALHCVANSKNSNSVEGSRAKTCKEKDYYKCLLLFKTSIISGINNFVSTSLTKLLPRITNAKSELAEIFLLCNK